MGKVIETKEGTKLRRVSRWIKIRQNYSPTPRNSLWYYVMDGNGYREGQEKFDKNTGLYLNYFVWCGRKWAMEQFLRLPNFPVMWEENGKLHWVCGYDAENYFNPIQIEIDEYGEYVRVYEEVKNGQENN